MNGAGAERRALRPLWWLATGAALGAVAAIATDLTLPAPIGRALIVSGAAAAMAALAVPRWWPLWLVAGLALGGGRGADANAERLRTAELAATGNAAALRVELTIREGWEPSRWGWRTTVGVRNARHGDQTFRLRGRWRLEVRGGATGRELPAPGSVVAALATIRGDEDRQAVVREDAVGRLHRRAVVVDHLPARAALLPYYQRPRLGRRIRGVDIVDVDLAHGGRVSRAENAQRAPEPQLRCPSHRSHAVGKRQR
mgnify:CR=1 FL=1